MGRKTHTKKIRTREMYLAGKAFGPVMMNTIHGTVLLNVMKHYCYNKPYENQEYEAIMLHQVRQMFKQANENKEKANANN